MRWACGAFLLILSSCATPNGDRPSIAAPESRHERMLDRLFGEIREGRAPDPEAELSFEESLMRVKFPFFVGDVLEVRMPSGIPEPPRPADFGLYANPIP